MTPSRSGRMGPREIDKALATLVEHQFASGWERHSNLRYWRVEFGGDMAEKQLSHTPWYSQAQICAWIDGARSMGAGI